MGFNKVRLARLKAGDKSQVKAAARLRKTGKTWFEWERDDSMPEDQYTLYLALTGQHPDAPVRSFKAMVASPLLIEPRPSCWKPE